jgi:hypothetical protein
MIAGHATDIFCFAANSILKFLPSYDRIMGLIFFLFLFLFTANVPGQKWSP